MRMEKRKKYNPMTTTGLKTIALVSMTIDHIGAIVFPQYIILRLIGRLAFPIYCFLLVEGFYHTSSVVKYLERLGMFALISEIPFDIAFYGRIIDTSHQNVFMTLFIGLLAIKLCDNLNKYNMSAEVYIIKLEIWVMAAILAFIFNTDYSIYGIVMIFGFYLFRQMKLSMCIFECFLNACFASGLQSIAVFALIPIYAYNGEHGSKRFKMLFYWWYPLHLIVLYIIKMLI